MFAIDSMGLFIVSGLRKTHLFCKSAHQPFRYFRIIRQRSTILVRIESAYATSY